MPLRYRGDDEELSFISITAMVGTPMDITVEELAIESFYPADERTAASPQRKARTVTPDRLSLRALNRATLGRVVRRLGSAPGRSTGSGPGQDVRFAPVS